MSIDSFRRSQIKKRLKEFETLGRKGFVNFDFKPFINLEIKADMVSELAFCISTANSSAISGLKFQKSLEDSEVEKMKIDEIEELLKAAGVRFYKRKAEYIFDAIQNFEYVEKAIRKETNEARKLLLKIKGLGYKESSHFLRNIGRRDVAIIDRHILRWLSERFSIPKLTQRNYVIIEGVLKKVAERFRMNLAELDLFIWSEMTGKVLK